MIVLADINAAIAAEKAEVAAKIKTLTDQVATLQASVPPAGSIVLSPDDAQSLLAGIQAISTP